eukprot:jgi/Tetstr1/425376/TSEL_015823.t1
MPVMLTCTTTAPGEAATGAQEGEGEDGEDDELHESRHVPYSNSDDNFKFPFSHPWRARHLRSQPIPTPIQPLCLASPAFPTSAALAAHDLHMGQGALCGDPPPPLPTLTAAPLLLMPSSSLVIEHLFSPCHGPSAFEVEGVVEYSFSIHAFIGADPSTEARTMWLHHLPVISNKYPGRLPPSAFQDCHDETPMNINDITITELERLRSFTLVVPSPPCQPCQSAHCKQADTAESVPSAEDMEEGDEVLQGGQAPRDADVALINDHSNPGIDITTENERRDANLTIFRSIQKTWTHITATATDLHACTKRFPMPSRKGKRDVTSGTVKLSLPKVDAIEAIRL